MGIKLMEGDLPHGWHGIVQERREGRVRKLDPLLFSGRDVAELQVGVGELPKHLAGRTSEGALHRQQFFLRLREHVGPGPHEPLEHQPVGSQNREFHPAAQRERVDRQDLGPDEACRLTSPGGDVLEAAHHPLGVGRGRVLTAPQVGVGAEPVSLAVEGEVVNQALRESLG